MVPPRVVVEDGIGGRAVGQIVRASTASAVATAAAQGNKSANDVLSYCKLPPKAAATSAREYGLCWAGGVELLETLGALTCRSRHSFNGRPSRS